MESGRKERWVDSGLLLQQSFFSSNTMLPCVVNSDLSPKLHDSQNGYLSFQESKSANSWNGEEVRPKTRKWSSQGREKWVRIIKLIVFCKDK